MSYTEVHERATVSLEWLSDLSIVRDVVSSRQAGWKGAVVNL